jgi:hypothetical protein
LAGGFGFYVSFGGSLIGGASIDRCSGGLGTDGAVFALAIKEKPASSGKD